MPDWSTLLPELLCEISRKLSGLIDYIRFRAVCRTWRSSASNPTDLPPQLPWLFMPCNPYTSDSRRFFCFSTDTTYTLSLPESQGKHICGSNHGWLAIFDDSTTILSLLHPLKRSQISLPPFRNNCLHIQKAVLSADPTSVSGCTVGAITVGSTSLSFSRLGSNGWSQWSLIPPLDATFSIDVAYCDEKFYTIDFDGVVTIYQIGPPTIVTRIATTELALDEDDTWRFSLVESARELLLVVFYEFHEEKYPDSVYRLSDEKEPRWIKARSIGGRALYLCGNGFVSSSSGVLPGQKGDCLYHVKYMLTGGAGKMPIRVFDLKDGIIKRLHYEWDYPCGGSWPAWFVPKL